MKPDSLTLGSALAQTASLHGDRLALIGADRTLTWSALDREVDQLVTVLRELGIGPGDVFALCTSKRPEVVVTMLALARMGAVAAPVNFKLEPGRIADQFATGGLRGVLLEARHDQVIDPLLTHVGDRVLYVGGMGRFSGRSYDEVSAAAPVDARPQVDPQSVCYLNYTSGSTGRPKGARVSHANILWNALSGVDGLGFGADEVFLCMFSVFAHPHELFHRALLTGAACVVVDTMSPRVVAQLVARHRVTWMMAVPSFYEMMLDHITADRFDVGSLRVLEAGGAWVSPDTLARLEARFSCGFMPVWGSTETNGVALALRPDGERVHGATGSVVAHYEVGVFDDHGRPVPEGEQGELWVRGPAVSSAYQHMPEASALAFSSGWYRTADLVRREGEFYFFVGRKTDMLKVGGIRVYPLEIEQALVAHPEIAEAVVVRAEERVRGEVPRAIVRTVTGSTLDAQGVRAWCRKHLAVFKVPRIVEFWMQIPRLPNGKVDKHAVVQRPPAERDERP